MRRRQVLGEKHVSNPGSVVIKRLISDFIYQVSSGKSDINLFIKSRFLQVNLANLPEYAARVKGLSAQLQAAVATWR